MLSINLDLFLNPNCDFLSTMIRHFNFKGTTKKSEISYIYIQKRMTYQKPAAFCPATILLNTGGLLIINPKLK